jgi:hypothetical protein
MMTPVLCRVLHLHRWDRRGSWCRCRRCFAWFPEGKRLPDTAQTMLACGVPSLVVRLNWWLRRA